MSEKEQTWPAEEKWAEAWERSGLYHFDPARPRAETFVVDTPPPTVSGSLHVGHVFSYTQADVIVRQRRMLGLNPFYPMGWDDNGLPTERRVQNLYHVRVDVRAPHETLELQPVPAEARKTPPRPISRPAFIELCRRVTAEDEKVFEALWRRMGLSVDWRQTYATIDDHSRRLAQISFRELFEAGHLYSTYAPTMWDVDYQTAVAQAEIEERPQSGAFHEIVFSVEGGGRFVIATTRPELLPACVGVAAHPEDARYRSLIGRTAVTPLFGAPVPIFPSPLVDPEKGTGILMVCTFGDATDVTWWREQKLPLRQVLGRDGRLAPVVFGEGVWESRQPDVANASYAALAGKTVKQARAAIVERLRGEGALQGEPRPIERAVKFFEKGDQPLEIIPTRQWFVRLLDKKQDLIAYGEKIRWHPQFMSQRYFSWVEGLQFDWCISRQRYFGVPFPVWYAGGDHERPIVATENTMPVDPTVDVPPGYEAAARNQPGGFTAETDVFDTWFTSSLTPQIASGWKTDPERHAKLFPADLRPQSHEIIRTWAFYTIAKAMLHERSIPWQHVAISGWILDPDRKKMSKSKGNVVTPMHLIEQYTADGVRYWAAGARLGTDTAFDEKVLKVGKRLVTKLWNAAKFVHAAGPPTQTSAITAELDRAFVRRLAALVEEASVAFASFDYASALAATEGFFWRWFTDSYLELVKGRVRGEGPGRDSAVATLRLGFDVLVRLFAPVLPFVTEEIWSWSNPASIHRAPWPATAELDVPAPEDEESLALATAALSAINKRKTESGASVGRLVTALHLAAAPETLTRLARVQQDVLGAARASGVELVARPELAPATFEVLRCDVAPAGSASETQPG
jgi:valyl-tRNA synthetase